jgi:hypothetical protein
LVLGLMLYYLLSNTMYHVESYQVNDPQLPQKVLIATQGSDFKDGITAKILAHFMERDVFLQVVDIDDLSDINSSIYNVIVVMHTWEYGSAPESAKDFFALETLDKDKLVVLSTSGAQKHTVKGIDAITGESMIGKVDEVAEDMIKQITAKLNY